MQPIQAGYPVGFSYPTEYGDNLGQMRRYLKALKRRWPVLVVFALMGAMVGWVTTPGEKQNGPLGPQTRYYEATHTLIAPGPGVSDDEGSNRGVDLTQAAFLATAGEVPDRVAERLGVNSSQVEGWVLGVPRGDVSSLEITAIGVDPTMATSLADTTAAELVAYLDERAKANYQQALADAQADLDRYTAQREEIQARIVAGEGDPEELDAQLQAVFNSYSAAYTRWQALSQIEDPTTGLSTLEPAAAEAISETEYVMDTQRIRQGADYTPPSTTADQAEDINSPPAAPPDPKARAALGALVGLAAAVGLILVLDRFDSRLRRRDDVETATGLPVLAEIPPMSRSQQHSVEVVSSTTPRSRSAEAYRVVRSAVLFAATAEAVASTNGANGNGSGQPTRPKPSLVKGAVPIEDIPIGPQTIMVTSPGPSEGKTTTVANLAAVMAEGGLSVLVINCDFRRPRVHKYLVHEGSEASGTEMPVNSSGTDLGSVRAMRTEIPKVRLVTGIGENDPNANPLEIVAVQRKIVHAARNHFDVVLLDTAPILTTNDASELLPECDHVIMVVRNGKTKREAAMRTAEVLTRFDAPTLGVVFNGSDDTPAVQYYYNYYLDSTGKRVRGPGYLSDQVINSAPEAPQPTSSASVAPPETN